MLKDIKELESRWASEITDYEGMGNNIFCSTTHLFKGLESPIVILIGTGAIREERKDELLYVATSRANSHLIIVKIKFLKRRKAKHP